MSNARNVGPERNYYIARQSYSLLAKCQIDCYVSCRRTSADVCWNSFLPLCDLLRLKVVARKRLQLRRPEKNYPINVALRWFSTHVWWHGERISRLGWCSRYYFATMSEPTVDESRNGPFCSLTTAQSKPADHRVRDFRQTMLTAPNTAMTRRSGFSGSQPNHAVHRRTRRRYIQSWATCVREKELQIHPEHNLTCDASCCRPDASSSCTLGTVLLLS